MKRLTRLSLTQKLLGAIGLPLLLAFIALGLIVNTQLNNAIPPMLEDTSARQVEARANEVGRWIEGYRTLLSGLAKDERLAESVPVEEHLEWLASRHPGDATIESFYFADASGDTVTHSGARADISGRGYFQELVIDGTTDRLLADPVLSLVSGLPTAIIAETIFDESGSRVGLLGITLSMEAVSEITSAIDVGEGSYGYMVDSSGMVVAHPDPDLRMNLNVTDADQAGFQGVNALGQRMLSGEAGIGQVVSPFDGNVTMVWSPIPGTGGWALAAAIPSNVFTAVSTNLLFSLLIVGAVILLVLLVIVGFSARKALAPIKQTAQAMADIAQGKGDLTRRLTAHSQDEVGELAVQFNGFVERMQRTLQEVRGNARTVLAGASDMADGTQELSSRTEQAAANLQETSASMEEIHSTVSHTAQASEQANGLATNAAGVAERGNEAMTEMQAKMASIDASANKISDIIGLIDSIAFQTNILALNASVEAARAGEHGRGFAVVAQEVRNLASRSADAAKDIRGLIDTSVKHTQEGSQIVKGAAERMQELRQSVIQVSDVISEITAGAREQTSGIEQVNTAVAEMDTMTQQNASMVHQNAGLAATMRDNARRLDELMSEFILGEAELTEARPGPAVNRPALALPSAVTNPSQQAVKPASKRQQPARELEEDWETF
ncbi:methyl-accepting chemotaxis protein [Halomonas chromatireducens]|uniref:Methyl-accepting chemotaxis protein I n=1 Tax=Halomonas chromatireducens TaxID=507626 RepID=A0A0X8HDB6_9GAMM|nr:methyl-accepting chemotaxis protein [Halomonas chromatireducens]AMD00555.1 Methyl-accepting chemotaxis protein I [Halomonas chromatireducens]